jgi:hypothetical protein
MKATLDMHHWQPSYAVLTFLMDAEAARIVSGDEKMQVEVMPSNDGLFGPYHRWPSDKVECRRMFNNLVLPMIAQLPSVETIKVLTDRVPIEGFSSGHKFNFQRWVLAYSAGIRPLRATSLRDKGDRVRLSGHVTKRVVDDKLITITLRECTKEHWPQRNSDVDQWVMAARRLIHLGYHVVIVRDTNRADDPLGELDIDPDASRFLDWRARLYSRSALCLFVNNGPAWYALSLDVPVMLFKPTCETAHKSCKAESMAAYGIVQGEQIVGAPAHQRLVWHDDTADAIVDHVRQFMWSREEARCRIPNC